MLDRGLQFATEMTKELNRMLGIKTRLLMSYHLQINGQMERMSQELEQYLRFFIDHRQKDWPEWLVSAEFAVNNKCYDLDFVLSKRHTLILSNTRELNRELCTGSSTLYTKLQWSVLLLV